MVQIAIVCVCVVFVLSFALSSLSAYSMQATMIIYYAHLLYGTNF